MRVVSFKIHEELFEELDNYARMKGVPRSEVIRQAISLYLRLARVTSQHVEYRMVRLLA